MHITRAHAFQTVLRGMMLFTFLTLQLTSTHAQNTLTLAARKGESLALTTDSITLAPTTSADSLTLQMVFALVGNDLPREHHITVQPKLTDGTHTAVFPAIEIFGTWAYYHYVRDKHSRRRNTSSATNVTTASLPEATTLQYRSREANRLSRYCKAIAREPWMQTATLQLEASRVDGCGDTISRQEQALRQPTTTYNYHQEEGAREETLQHLQGSAYIAFPVSLTEVLPNFRKNRGELERLRHTIDSVNRDSTIEIVRIQIKGFASPEGPYDNNDRLARERTSSLTRYIIEKTSVSPVLFHTAYEAEDWQGLRTFVDTTTMVAHRQQLMQIIDSHMEPDAKLARINAEFPDDYQVFKTHAFPKLRHTDYQIDYQLKNITVHEGKTHVDSIRQLSLDPATMAPADTTDRRFTTFRPWLAVKTNLLFDAALTPNIEVEVPFGRDSRWSIMVEDWFPWFRFSHNEKGDANPYYRSDQRPTRHSYEVWTLGAELRYWLAPRCAASRPLLSGTFLGIYAAGGKYDVEHRSEGYQGEFTSFGLTIGHSWALSRHWNLELSVSGGYVGGPQRHYEAEFDDARLIFRNKDRLRYVGPTKLKLSLAWIIGSKAKKGGEQ